MVQNMDAFCFNYEIGGVSRMRRFAKLRLLSKRYEKRLWSSFQITKSTQTGQSDFADSFEEVKKVELQFRTDENCRSFRRWSW